MKTGVMYVLHGRKTSIPQKLLNIVKDFTDTCYIPTSVILYIRIEEQS